MQLSEDVTSGIKITFLSRIIGVVVNGLLILLLTRYLLGPGGYGVLFLVLSIITVGQLFADLGIGRSCARYLSEFKESDRSQIPHILSTSFQYRLLLISLVVGVLVFGRSLIADVLSEPALERLLLIGVAFLLFQSMTRFTSTVFQGFNAVEYSAVVNIVDNVGRIVFVIVFAGIGWGVGGALLGYAAGAVGATLLGLFVLYTKFYRKIDAASTPEPGLRRRIAEYSVPLTASRAANVIDRRVDILLIGFFLNPVAVAFYTLGKQITEFVMAPAGSVGFAVSPAYGEDKANGRLDHAARIYEESVKYMLLLYIPATVGILLVADPAVPLVFGADYTGAVPVLQVLAVLVLFQAVTSVTTQAIDYLGRARYRAIAKGGTSIANLGLNVVLIPRVGVLGAAIATVITYGIYTMTNVYIMHRELPLRYAQILRVGVGTTLVSGVMGGFLIVLAPHVNGVLSLVAVVALGVLVWASLVTASGLVNTRRTLSFFT